MDEVNVLVIEDKEEDSVFLESILKTSGFKVWAASSAKDGIKLVKNIPFAAVITELHMPRMNGAEITRAVFKINPYVSVVVITPYFFINEAVKVMEEGAHGYITKPFNSAEVRIVAERAVERFFMLSSDEEKEQFFELSVRDGLTGLYNRRFLDRYLANKVLAAGDSGEKFSLLMIDIDNFKKFNDTKGHLAGDELLKNLCRVIKESLRKEDIAFRYGGEEFLIFLKDVDKKAAFLMAERIRNSVKLYTQVTISMGVGTFPDDGKTAEELIRKADSALYQAKDTGRDKVVVVK